MGGRNSSTDHRSVQPRSKPRLSTQPAPSPTMTDRLTGSGRAAVVATGNHPGSSPWFMAQRSARYGHELAGFTTRTPVARQLLADRYLHTLDVIC